MRLIWFVTVLLVQSAVSLSNNNNNNDNMMRTSRRKMLHSALVVGSVLVQQQMHHPLSGQVAHAASLDELPSFVRPYTNLVPIPPPSAAMSRKGSSRTSQAAQKTTGLGLQELSSRLTNDLSNGANGRGGYFLTGDLSTDIFRDDCIFLDPTNEVASLAKYQQALGVLFDPESSVVEIISPLVVDEDKRTISGTIRSRGFLRFPWRPYVSAYESRIVYHIDENGLVEKQVQEWSKSAGEALQETFQPSWFSPPPKSTLVQIPDGEPKVVSELFAKVNGRRPAEYSDQEKVEIGALVDCIANDRVPWDGTLLPGRWMTVFLQPGPSGIGIDRRIPFPEFDFNDSFQVFGTDGSINNIGEVFGPLVQVQVGGSLTEADPSSNASPKRFMAAIEGGKLCWRDDPCLSLPIKGDGLFDIVYVGPRVRVGQNINGGGARVVQVRLG